MLNKEMEGFQMETVHIESFLAGMKYQKQLMKKENKKNNSIENEIKEKTIEEKVMEVIEYKVGEIAFIKDLTEAFKETNTTSFQRNKIFIKMGARKSKRFIEGKQQNVWINIKIKI